MDIIQYRGYIGILWGYYRDIAGFWDPSCSLGYGIPPISRKKDLGFRV